MASKGLTILLVLLVAAPTALVAPASAHPGDGNSPVTVEVEVVSITPKSDLDDGWDGNAELEVTYDIENVGHDSIEGKDPFWGEHQYDWDEKEGEPKSLYASHPAGDRVYIHHQCNFKGLEVTAHIEEDDAGDDDDLGSGSVEVTPTEHPAQPPEGTGKRTIETDDAVLEIRITVEAMSGSRPDALDDNHCTPVSYSLDGGVTGELATTLQANRGLTTEGPGDRLLANERINVQVGDETLGVKTDGQGRVDSLVGGPVANPTMQVSMDRATAQEIARADDPGQAIRENVQDGDITYRGVGPSNRAKFGATNLVRSCADVGASLGHSVAGFARSLGGSGHDVGVSLPSV